MRCGRLQGFSWERLLNPFYEVDEGDSLHRIRRLASLLLEKYPEKFTEDFETNKKALKEVAIITSKQLKNELAGYITHYIKKQKGKEKKEFAQQIRPR